MTGFGFIQVESTLENVDDDIPGHFQYKQPSSKVSGFCKGCAFKKDKKENNTKGNYSYRGEASGGGMSSSGSGSGSSACRQ